MNDDYTFWIHKDAPEFVSELSPVLTGADEFAWSKLYSYFHETQLALMLSKN